MQKESALCFKLGIDDCEIIVVSISTYVFLLILSGKPISHIIMWYYTFVATFVHYTTDLCVCHLSRKTTKCKNIIPTSYFPTNTIRSLDDRRGGHDRCALRKCHACERGTIRHSSLWCRSARSLAVLKRPGRVESLPWPNVDARPREQPAAVRNSHWNGNVSARSA